MLNLLPKPANIEEYHSEKCALLKLKVGMVTNRLALPLFLAFWICDIFYAPSLMWTFLGLRLLVIPAHFVFNIFISKVNNLRDSEWLAFSLISFFSIVINSMIFLIDDYSSPYYAGLNLIAIGALAFIPWRTPFFIGTLATLFLPYYVGFLLFGSEEQTNVLLVNTFFIAGTSIITLVIHLFQEGLQVKEFNVRSQLNDELKNRENIIKEKTKEGLRLATLSSQFSPQVIEAIKNGERTITNQRHRSEICAIFIDAVSSTDRLVRLDHKSFIVAIEDFMELSINTLLKYDLTIDKFYGDGVLAFANDPMKRSDFIERTCLAAVEIRDQIQENQSTFKKSWKKDFDVTIGIASGFASVGFYGNRSFIKQYSAIGTCLALSQRLSSIAGPNEILVDGHIQEILQKKKFKTKRKGEFNLKGFGDDIFEVFNVLGAADSHQHGSFNVECSYCNENTLFIDDENGIYVLRCRKCDAINDESLLVEEKKAS